MTPVPHWSTGVLARRRDGDYVVATLAAGEVAEHARPGQYLSVQLDGPGSAHVLRRQLWIAGQSAGGRHGGALEVAARAGTVAGDWLLRATDSGGLDVLGPLGRPFSLPRQPVQCLVVGFGAAGAGLLLLLEQLHLRGNRVTYLAADDGPPGRMIIKRLATEMLEGVGESDLSGVLAAAARRTDVVYSAGAAAQVRAVAAVTAASDLPHQTALQLPLLCGTTTCTGCALPVRGRDGVTRMVRACAEGAVFHADLVRWADLGTVPGDCLGAPGEVPA